MSTSGPISISLLAGRGEQILSTLSKIGVVVPPSNRLSQSCHVLRDAAREAPNPEDHATRTTIAAAFRNVWEAFIIVHAGRISESMSAICAQSALECLLKGAVIADGESNAQARNEQHELYVAALMTLAGLEVEKGEPDLVTEFNGHKVGIAIKRMTSSHLETFRTHVRKSIRQLNRQSLRGFIAVSMDAWLESAHLDDDSITASVDAIFENVRQVIAEQNGYGVLIGAMIFGTTLDFDYKMNPTGLLTYNIRRYHIFPADAKESAAAVTYFDSVEAALDRRMDDEMIPLVSNNN